MLGWSILITRQNYSRYRKTFDRDAMLAGWTARLTGLDWIEHLVQDGKAARVRSGGFPSIYTARARHIVLLLVSDRPPTTCEHPCKPGDEPWDVTVNRTAIDSTAPNQMLTIVAWDQS